MGGAVARFEALTEPQILDKLSNKDAEVRRDAAKSFGKVQGDNIAVFSLVTNTLAKDQEIEDRWRNAWRTSLGTACTRCWRCGRVRSWRTRRSVWPRPLRCSARC